jgi:hypothetical protein
MTLALALLLASSLSGSPADTPRPDGAWNLSVGTGDGGFADFTDGLVGGVASGLGGYEVRRRDRLQLNVRADHELSRWLRAGVAYTRLTWARDYYAGSGTFAGSIDATFQVLLADATLRWTRSERWELYSGVAVGGATWGEEGDVAGIHHDDRQSGFAFQLRFIGASVGWERVRFFGELGVGFEGLLIGGLTVRL